jgi:DNA-binding NarL/FixJ family response regulator
LIDEETKKRVRQLLSAVRERPTELPLAEVVGLADAKLSVTVDREGDEPVVYVMPRPDPRFDVLTERELEVATLVAAGFSNAQIGEALFIATTTVKDHVHSILAKTDLKSRSEVAACWYGGL